MIATGTSKRVSPSLGRDLLAAARYHLGGRRGLLIFGAVAAAGGLASSWGWGWLVATGIAPLLVSVLPCAAMCALGLCMSRTGRGSGAAETGAPNAAALVGDQRQLQLALAPAAESATEQKAQLSSRTTATLRPPGKDHDSCCSRG